VYAVRPATAPPLPTTTKKYVKRAAAVEEEFVDTYAAADSVPALEDCGLAEALLPVGEVVLQQWTSIDAVVARYCKLPLEGEDLWRWATCACLGGFNEARKERDEHSASVKRVCEEYARTRAENSQIAYDCRMANQHRAEAEHRIEDAQGEVRAERRIANNARFTAENAMKEVVKLKTRVAALQAETESLQQNATDLRAKQETDAKTIASLREENTRLEAELDRRTKKKKKKRKKSPADKRSRR
jgi:hypothetical protein